MDGAVVPPAQLLAITVKREIKTMQHRRGVGEMRGIRADFSRFQAGRSMAPGLRPGGSPITN